MPTKTCNTCNLTLDFYSSSRHKCKQCKSCRDCNLNLNISNFRKNGKYYSRKCNRCIKEQSKCKHNIQKRDCGECSPQFFCNICLRYISGRCQKCYDKSRQCRHNKRKQKCYRCSPGNVCKHENWKTMCIKCNGSALCIHCKHTIGTKRYVESLDKKIRCCAGCFYYYYPNDEIPRRYKLKQHYFNEKLIEEFGVNFFQYDKKIKCGCSGRMPDWFIDCYKYSIIIELDEDQHKYESCDEKRMMELFQDLGNRPLVLIRINPDKYKGRTKKRKGCFDFDEKNILICNEKKFNKRFNRLVKMIKYYIDNEPEKEITMEKLFFDK